MTAVRPAPPLRGISIALSERRIFNVAVGFLLLHAFDDAVLSRGPGVGVGHYAGALALSVVTCVAAVFGFGRLRAGARATLAVALAVPGAANAAMHVMHVNEDGVAGGDVTGLLAAAASIVLIGLGVVLMWRSRGTAGRSPQRRWALGIGAAGAGYLAASLVAFPLIMGIAGVHKPRHSIGPAPAGYASVEFESTDGLELHGWYRPSRNGAAVIVAHGGGSTRRGGMHHAEMLADHGYGVLVYDTRGSGESEGPHNSWGWDWEKDAAGALDYLQGRTDVDPGRIAGLGLSSGADGLVAMAADHPELAALVADGTAARTAEDIRRSDDLNLVDRLGVGIMFGASRVFSGMEPGRPLEDAARDIESPLLLVSAAREDEYRMSKLYAEAAGPVAEHWNLPDATHTHAIYSDRAAYEQRVIAFLDRNVR